MAEVEVVAKEVRQRWLSQGLRPSSVKPEELVALSRLAPEGVPKEYEAFLRIAGLPDDEDAAGFRFWRPTEVRVTSDVLHAAGYAIDAIERSVIIADYLQESWWYGLWLSGRFAGQVSLVLGQADGKDPQPPLGSFAEFLLAYLGDDVRLYPPA
jgi:hypothetical protein